MIERWLNVPRQCKTIFRAPARGAPRKSALRPRIISLAQGLEPAGYIELFSTKRRRVVLGSGHK